MDGLCILLYFHHFVVVDRNYVPVVWVLFLVVNGCFRSWNPVKRHPIQVLQIGEMEQRGRYVLDWSLPNDHPFGLGLGHFKEDLLSELQYSSGECCVEHLVLLNDGTPILGIFRGLERRVPRGGTLLAWGTCSKRFEIHCGGCRLELLREGHPAFFLLFILFNCFNVVIKGIFLSVVTDHLVEINETFLLLNLFVPLNVELVFLALIESFHWQAKGLLYHYLLSFICFPFWTSIITDQCISASHFG